MIYLLEEVFIILLFASADISRVATVIYVNQLAATAHPGLPALQTIRLNLMHLFLNLEEGDSRILPGLKRKRR